MHLASQKLTRLTRVLFFSVSLLTLLLIGLSVPLTVNGQGVVTPTPSAFVEAIKIAKVRAGPGTNYDEIGSIAAGTTYRLVGRSAHFPWYLIALPNSLGWVYADLVKVTGNIKSVPFDETIIDANTAKQANATSESSATPLDFTASPTLTLPPVTVPPIVATGVTVFAIENTNVRAGPGLNYPLLGKLTAGQSYPVLRRHAHFPWLEIAFSGTAGGRAWVAQLAVQINGALTAVPATNDTTFDYPTMTPTGQMVVTTAPQFTATAVESLNPVLQAVGEDIYAYLLKQQFQPGTDRQGSVFIMNLQTGHMYSINPYVAYSGASLMKIPEMVAFYRKVNRPVNASEARLLADMMVCSENGSANTLLQFLGDGSESAGTAYVQDTVRRLGMTHTLFGRSFVVPIAGATATPIVTPSINTGVDQSSTQADPLSQTTPADMGILMSEIYQCGSSNLGPLLTTYPNDITPDECRQMITLMKGNQINNLIEAGLPKSQDVSVAHKQGFVADMNGDAGIVFTPGGDYVLVVMLYAKKYLNYSSSFPTIAEISRLTYNAFNQSRALDKISAGTIPQCVLNPDLLTSLQTPTAPQLK